MISGLKAIRPRGQDRRFAPFLVPAMLALASLGLFSAAGGAQETAPSMPDKTVKPDRPEAGRDSEARPGESASPANEAWAREMRELERLAQENPGRAGQAKGPSGWSMGFWLAFIVALAGGSIWAIVKYKRRMAGDAEVDEMRIVSRRAIDPRNSVVILRARGRDYLLGLGPSGVSLLTMLPSAPPPAQAAAKTVAKPNGEVAGPPVSEP